MQRLLLTPILSLLLCLCLSAQTDLAANLINADLVKSANAVVRYHDIVVTIEDVDKYYLTHNTAITLLSAKAEEHLFQSVYYDQKDKEIKEFNMKLYDGDGKLKKELKKKDLIDFKSSDGFSLVTDGRLKFHKFTVSEYPVTITLTAKYEKEWTAYIPSWNPLFTDNMAVEKSTYRVINETEYELAKKEVNLKHFDNISYENGQYVARNLTAIKKEKFAPSLGELAPKVHHQLLTFSYYGYEGSAESWSDFGKWNYDSFIKNNRFSDPNSVKAEVQPYLAAATSKKDSIKAVYDFVQENTRYISIQLNVGGWKPMSLDKVHKLKYGDCKALSNYTVNILDLYDIPADYVIVYAGRDVQQSMFDDFVSGNQANHIIVRVPEIEDKDVWLECTSHDNPFDFLGAFTDNRKALAVNKDSAMLVKTPAYKGLNKIEYTTEVDMQDTEAISLSSTVSRKGFNYNSGIYLSKLNKEDREEYLKNKLFDFLDVRSIKSATFDQDESALRTKEIYELTVKGLTETMGDYLLVPFKFHELGVPKLNTKAKRRNDIVFLRGTERVAKTTYLIPEGLSVDAAAAEVKLNSKYCDYERHLSLDGAVLTVERRFVLNSGRYPATEYKKIAEAFKSIRKSESESITLLKRT